VLRVEEDLVPQPRLEVRLHLRQVEVGAAAAAHELPRVVEEVHPEVEERPGDGPAVDDEVRLGEVPPPRAHEQHRRARLQRVPLPARGVLERDRAADRVGEVRLPLDLVAPRGGVRVLEVGHEGLRARVQRVDDHLAVDGAGDLDAAVEEVARERGDLPVSGADVRGGGEEVRELAGVEVGLF